MTVDHKIWHFPKMAIQSQLFHVPGSYFDGGFTSGGARIMSPEPGGRSVLEVTLSLQVNEWNTPFSSWIMSKVNGEIFKIPLVETPQLVRLGDRQPEYQPWDNDQFWDNNQPWDNDGAYLEASRQASEGETSLRVSMQSFGEVIRHGHVIGVGNHSYIVDNVEYENDVAILSLKPPLRKDVNVDDTVFLKPFFLGTIVNGSEIRNAYDASNAGAIQLNRIVFQEVVI